MGTRRRRPRPRRARCTCCATATSTLDGLEDLLHHRSGLHGTGGSDRLPRPARGGRLRGRSRPGRRTTSTCHRLRKYVGAYLRRPGRAPTSSSSPPASASTRPRVRERLRCTAWSALGIVARRRPQRARRRGTPDLRRRLADVAVLVVPTERGARDRARDPRPLARPDARSRRWSTPRRTETTFRSQLRRRRRATSSRGPRAGRRRGRGSTAGPGAGCRPSPGAATPPASPRPGRAVDDVHDQVVAVHVVHHHHVERRRGGALLLVAAHVQVLRCWCGGRSAGGSATGSRGRRRSPARRCRRGCRSRRGGIPCGCSVSSCSRIRSTTLTNRTRSSGSRSRRIFTAARVSRVGTSPAQAITTSGSSLVVGGPLPDAGAPGAVQVRLVAGQPVERRLLAGHHDVDVVPTLEAVLHRREQGVGVRREVDADDLGRLVDDVVDEAGVLVGEAVVVLAPHVRAEQVVEARRPGGRQLDVAGGLEPLRVLVEHRVDEVDERLVAAEETVPPGEQCSPRPSPGRCARRGSRPPGRSAPGARRCRGSRRRRPCRSPRRPGRAGWTRSRPGRRSGSWSGLSRTTSTRYSPSTRVGSWIDAPGCGHLDRVVAEVRQRQRLASAGRRWRAGWRSSGGCPSAPAPAAPRPDAVVVEELLGAVGPHPLLELGAVLVVVAGRRPAAPGGRARCPRPGGRRRPSGRSSPSGSPSGSSATAGARRRRPPGRRARSRGSRRGRGPSPRPSAGARRRGRRPRP